MDLRGRQPTAREGRPLVIGHRGAAGIAPENSLEGLAAAVAAGADLAEFDVRRASDGAGLALGHPGVEAAGPELVLDDALAYLAAQEIGIHVDLKLVGAEAELVAALRRHAVEERTLVSSTWARSLRRLGDLAPLVTCAISYPRDRVGAAALPWPPAAIVASAAMLRTAMPARARILLSASGAGALSLHHALVSPAVVRQAHARGAAVIAWTVDDPRLVEVLARSNVDAIVSNDPGMIISVLATLRGLESTR